MHRELNWGIIGVGDVVRHKNGPSIQQSGRSRITVLMRRDATKLMPFGDLFEVQQLTDDATVLFRDLTIDVIYVVTPPNSHHDYVITAARAGKYVLTEKPMAMNVGEAERMIEACDDAGVELFVAYYCWFRPHVQHRQVVRDHVIAEIGKKLVQCPGEVGWPRRRLTATRHNSNRNGLSYRVPCRSCPEP